MTAQRIEAGTDETPQEVRPEGQEPDPKDAPKRPHPRNTTMKTASTEREAIVAEAAANLSAFTKADLRGADPDKVVAPLATLMDLCISGLADIREDNSVFLTVLGFKVQTYIKDQDHGRA